MPLKERLQRWLPVAAWMTAIFFASTDAFSAGHTSRIILPLLRWLSGGRLSPDALDYLHFLIRKGAHLSEYALLAILVWRAVNRSGHFRDTAMTRQEICLALLICVLYAASDEFHQSFVPSRTSSAHDVAIDTVGAMIGLAIIALTRRRRSDASAQAGPG